MPIDAKLGMSNASTKETFIISGLFSFRRKNCEAAKKPHGIADRTAGKKAHFSAKLGINRIKQRSTDSQTRNA
jgi:hypothetical protein